MSEAQISSNPFDLEASQWKSSEHYKDSSDRAESAAQKKAAELHEKKKAAEKAAHAVTPPEPKPAAQQPEPTTSSKLIVPSAMPGLNKGYSVHVSSTEDAHEDNIATQEDEPVATPDIRISDKNWKAPVAGSDARKGQDSEEGEEEEGTQALNVRMTFLPNKKVTATPSPEHPSAQKAGHQLLKKNTQIPMEAAAPAKTPSERAACAAIDAYKKQQLDAIQSDRQTLQALQDAIHSLGLNKQLDFMTGTDGTLNTAKNQTPTPENPPTSVR